MRTSTSGQRKPLGAHQTGQGQARPQLQLRKHNSPPLVRPRHQLGKQCNQHQHTTQLRHQHPNQQGAKESTRPRKNSDAIRGGTGFKWRKVHRSR